MTEVCTVKKVSRRGVFVELKRSEQCDGCKICAFNRKNAIVVPARSDVPVKAGDTVVAEMPTVSVGAGALLIYALPLLFIVIGALIGLVGGLWLQVGLAALGLVLGLVAAWLIDRAYRRRDGVIPRIVRLYDKAAESCGDTTDVHGGQADTENAQEKTKGEQNGT